MTTIWIDFFPLWLLFILTVAMVLLSVEVGRFAALRFRNRSVKPAEGPVGAVIGSTLGLLAFLLAFTFSIAATRFDTRRQELLSEVIAIRTCHLRSGLIPARQKELVRNLLKEYVHHRLELANQPSRLSEQMPGFLKISAELHAKLWKEAEHYAEKDPNSEICTLFVDSINSVINAHTRRLVIARYRIPGSIWIALYVVSIVSMTAVGYHFGLSGYWDLFVNVFLALTYAIVILLIADLDNPSAGYLYVSHQPVFELEQELIKDSLAPGKP